MGTSRKNILILTYWSYNDALIQTYTLPYVKLIADTLVEDGKIFLLTLDKNENPQFEKIPKIQNISIPYKPVGIAAMFLWLRTIIKLLILIRKEKITTIHAWCTPAGMIGYLISVLTGKELIIDSFEPHAETMIENGVWKKNSSAFKLLFQFEKLQAHRAKYLIAISEKMRDYAATKYNHHKQNYFVKPACVDLDLFSYKNRKNPSLLKELGLENKLVCAYAGKFGGIYLEKEAFDFFKIAENFWGEQFRVLILTSSTEKEIENYRINSGLKKETVVQRFVQHAKIPDYIGLGDFAFTPVKPIETKRYCSPIKDGEYWALGLPIVITKNISDDSDIIKANQIGSVLEELNQEAYLSSVKEIDTLLKKHTQKDLYTKIRVIAETKRNFNIAWKIYNTIYN